jgi:hypothetical protein
MTQLSSSQINCHQGGTMTRKLPIPLGQLHYADPSVNDEAQTSPIAVFIDRIHYPTLGCPALLTPERSLDIILSLPEGASPSDVSLSLVDRHEAGGERPLQPAAPPEALGFGPFGNTGRRQAWRVTCSLVGFPHRLFDLQAAWSGGSEIQHNAVRIYGCISGEENVLVCGDSQYHVLNGVCLERLIEHVNARDDIAWLALIGDVCDNQVTGVFHMLRLALAAAPGPVTCHYLDEYRNVRTNLLPRLNKPVLLVPGNHDGMVAYDHYLPGKVTEAFVGPDPANVVAYDGLHHYRRSLGPLYYGFDWGNTRYLCLNSFELNRHDRLGYHAVVANWGGCMRPEQLAWVRQEIEEATSRGMRTVVLMHHDPRGGSLGKDLGYYHHFRQYDYTNLRSIVVDYIKYLAHNSSRWQQEWMSREGEDLATPPAKDLLALLIKHKVWGVFMGHDNENWVESYFKGDDIFVVQPRRVEYALASEGQPVDPVRVERAVEMIEDDELKKLESLLSDGTDADAVLEHAMERLDAKDHFAPAQTFAPDAAKGWGITAQAPVHFVHVNDVGAYKYAREEDFRAYGYVLAKLGEGRPTSLQSFDLAEGGSHESISLEED